MSRSATFTFNDPIPYQAAIWGAEVEVLISVKGNFNAELTKIDFGRVWMSHVEENLPTLFRINPNANRAAVIFLANANQPNIQHSGMDVPSDAIIVCGPGEPRHMRTPGACRWASMSLTPDDFLATGCMLAGHELTTGPVARLVHPRPAHMKRLVGLHAATRHLAEAAPDILEHCEVSRALEHELVCAMVACVDDDVEPKAGSGWCHHTAIIKRFEEVLEANCARPMYLAEICAAVGTSQRTLQVCCEEHLGMSPIRYLWLRRMHLARRVLLEADPAHTTVTQIATDHGFWELGRFAVSYKGLFGESPSASLHRPSGDCRAGQHRPSGFADSQFA